MKIRRQFITDCVERYKQNYGGEYELFLYQLQKRKDEMKDKRLGMTRDDNEIRLAVSMPERLYGMLSVALDGEHEKNFGDDKGEMEWFVKKFPEFLVPNQY